LNFCVKEKSPIIKREKLLKIGFPSFCDENVKLGYIPERRLELLDLVIGVRARIRSGTIIYAGTKIGNNFEAGHNVLIREENEIGDNVSVWSNTVIDYGCSIGNRVKIHCNVYIPQLTIIEDNVFIAPGCSFANDLHPGCKYSRDCMRGPVIKRGARIGVNVTILPKIIVGESSLVGAGSVITKNVPPYSVVFGNPARSFKKAREIKCKRNLLGHFPYRE